MFDFGIRWRLIGLVLFVIPVVSRGDAPPPASAEQHPLDPAMALIRQCREDFTGYRDYTCMLIRQERVDGVLKPTEEIEAKFRLQPASVYFRWVSPESGREEIYVEGENENMIVAHATGVSRLWSGTFHIDPDGTKARRTGRHSTRDAGLVTFMDKLLGRWQFERQFDETDVTMANVKLNGRPCVLIETVHPKADSRKYMFHTLKVYVDREWRVPVRMEGYGFPEPGVTGDAPSTGPLLESYTYLNLQFNVGLTSLDFSPSNPNYGYGWL